MDFHSKWNMELVTFSLLKKTLFLELIKNFFITLKKLNSLIKFQNCSFDFVSNSFIKIQ